MVVGDSQWLGRGSREGHYVDLSKWMNDHSVPSTMTAASIKGYSEFPKGSQRYWAVPVQGDAMGFAYRRDFFEDPQEIKTFFDKYGYPLDVPQTWNELRDIAEHFYRPEVDFYGLLVWAEPDYDGITMGVNTLLWAWGADLGDHSTYRVKGVLNSDEGIEALKFYRSLYQFGKPEWEKNYLDTKLNSNIPLMRGKVAMAMGYFAINSELLDKDRNPYAEHMGFFSAPKGPVRKVCSLGGQGVSVISYTKKKDSCFKFLEWFIQDSVQERWAELGGLSCNKKVLESEKFLNASPLNGAFKESIELADDFWAVPEYPVLLKISQKYFNKYVTKGDITAKEALDKIADEWEEVFEHAGYYKE
jgi:multiple sugar transport system substrate-binding protein